MYTCYEDSVYTMRYVCNLPFLELVMGHCRINGQTNRKQRLMHLLIDVGTVNEFSCGYI